MKCPKCQFENEEGSKFCLECGEGLELKCPQCGKILPLLAKFCNECGERLERVVETEKAVLEAEGERKHVTVLFSDLSGYTAMSEKLDPEELKEIITPNSTGVPPAWRMPWVAYSATCFKFVWPGTRRFQEFAIPMRGRSRSTSL